jgi:galactose-1-phosphate uridylyltransferase
MAGLELGADIAVVTVDPESAAAALRAAWPQG